MEDVCRPVQVKEIVQETIFATEMIAFHQFVQPIPNVVTQGNVKMKDAFLIALVLHPMYARVIGVG